MSGTNPAEFKVTITNESIEIRRADPPSLAVRTLSANTPQGRELTRAFSAALAEAVRLEIERDQLLGRDKMLRAVLAALDDHSDTVDSGDGKPVANWCLSLAAEIRRECPGVEKP